MSIVQQFLEAINVPCDRCGFFQCTGFCNLDAICDIEGCEEKAEFRVERFPQDLDSCHFHVADFVVGSVCTNAVFVLNGHNPTIKYEYDRKKQVIKDHD